MREPTPHVLFIGDVSVLNLNRTDYRVDMIDDFKSSRDLNRALRKLNPLLVVKVISNGSADEAKRDLDAALAIESSTVLGLHFLNPETPDLVLTDSCNINRLTNVIVCEPEVHNPTEIVNWVVQSELPGLAAQRLESFDMPERPTLTERLLGIPDPRPALKTLARRAVRPYQQQVHREANLMFGERTVRIRILMATATRINIEVKTGQTRLGAGAKVYIMDEDVQKRSLVLGRAGNQSVLAQTEPPIRLRRGMRMSYTTKVMVSSQEESSVVLGYDLSSSGICVQEPQDLALYIGQEALLTTSLRGMLDDEELRIELDLEPARAVRFFEREGKQLVSFTFRRPQLPLTNMAELAEAKAETFEAFMVDKEREYEREFTYEAGNRP